MSEERDPQTEMARLSRRGLIWAGAAMVGTYMGYRFLDGAAKEGQLPYPFRKALETNEVVWGDLFRQYASVPTFDPSQRTPNPRVNGGYGLPDGFDPATWKLSVENSYGSKEPVILTLDDVKRLPRYEFTALFCCIEGWNQIVPWAGTRFSDFAAVHMPPTQKGDSPDFKRPQDLVRYVYMATPDHGYYVGLDMQSVLHPQTLLCYEMNGQPLPINHGGPLRLVIPTKYGVKNIKRLGLIRYTDQKPPDFWAEQGYDWFAGL